jgi:hypothetical protein
MFIVTIEAWGNKFKGRLGYRHGKVASVSRSTANAKDPLNNGLGGADPAESSRRKGAETEHTNLS